MISDRGRLVPAFPEMSRISGGDVSDMGRWICLVGPNDWPRTGKTCEEGLRYVKRNRNRPNKAD